MVVVEETHPEKLIPWAKVLVVTPILYSAAVCLPKLAILVFYSRIFVTRLQLGATYTLMGIVVAIAISDMIAGGLQCVPLEYLWNKEIEGSCYDIPAFYRYGTLPNAITDLFMLLLPLPVIWSLQMSMRTKIGLLATFLAGSV